MSILDTRTATTSPDVAPAPTVFLAHVDGVTAPKIDGGTRRVRIAGHTPVLHDSATTFPGDVVLYLAPGAVIPADDPDLQVVADCERDGTLRQVPSDGEGAAIGLDRLHLYERVIAYARRACFGDEHAPSRVEVGLLVGIDLADAFRTA